jgi:hypothetical protein
MKVMNTMRNGTVSKRFFDLNDPHQTYIRLSLNQVETILELVL